MIINSDTSGIDDLIKRVRSAQGSMQPLLEQAAHASGETVKDWLSTASPRGRGGPPPPGDAPGPLAESYRVVEKHQSNAAAIAVETMQPLKLQYVTQGTGVYVGKGRIIPTKKRALYWDGAAHPVRSVAGQRANDFVGPVLAKVDGAVEVEMELVVKKLDEIMEG